MKDVRPHGHVIDTNFDMEAVFAAIDHVSDLLPRVVPELPLRVDAPDMGDVLPRTVRVRFSNARNLVGHDQLHKGGIDVPQKGSRVDLGRERDISSVVEKPIRSRLPGARNGTLEAA
jgi:hypothetical protein